MKKALTLCLSLMISTVMTAQNDYSKYYKNLPVQMPVAVGPTIPDNNISLKDAGGTGRRRHDEYGSIQQGDQRT
jgi:uncharacterized membrane protein